MELFCPTLHLRSGDKKESFAIYIEVGIRRSEIIKRNLIDSGLYVHERARCSHGKPDRRKRKCCRAGHMHVGTGSGCLPTDTVTETGLRVVFAPRNNGTRQTLCNLVQGKTVLNVYKEDRVVSVEAIKAYKGVEVCFHSFLILVLDWNGRLHSGGFGRGKNP